MNRQTALCTMMHFLVDGLCICCLYLIVAPSAATGWMGVFVAYNVLAFLTQPLTGYMADRVRERHWLLLASMLLLTMASVASVAMGMMGMPPWGLWTVAVMLGMGNSLFHVWGGKLTAVNSHNDIRDLGVFVSAGAFGLAVGGVCCSWTLLGILLLAFCLLGITYVRIEPATVASVPGGDGETGVRDFITPMDKEAHRLLTHSVVWVVMAAIMAFVMGRSLIGGLFSADIGKSTWLILLAGGISMAGKMAGGWMARAVGLVRALVVLILASLIAWLFCRGHQVVALAGLFLINCTMPITLYLANVVMKDREGLAFGLLAAALIPGYFLTLL